MKRRVVITGMGAVTPIGNTIEEFWDRSKEFCRKRTNGL